MNDATIKSQTTLHATTLQEYAEVLSKYDGKGVPQVEGINTLWLPYDNSNRRAMLNLNHQILCGDYDGDTTQLCGANWNCGTEYAIIQVPDSLTNESLVDLNAKLVAIEESTNRKHLGLLHGFNADFIKEVLAGHFPDHG